MTGVPTDFLYSVALIEVTFRGNDGEVVQRNGSGFFVGASRGIYLVTNRHVIDIKWYNSDKYRGYCVSKILCRARINNDELIKFEINSNIIFSDCFSDDVAVILLDKKIIATAKSAITNDVLIIRRFFNFSDLSDDNSFKNEIWPCDQVIFPGYGDGSFITADSEDDVRPIFRVGWISSDPTIPLRHKEVKGDAFLVEGFSTSGASGSPVIAPPVGTQLGGGLTMTGGRAYRPMRVVGVNAGHLKSHDFQHALVSYAFKATIIRRLIQKAEQNATDPTKPPPGSRT